MHPSPRLPLAPGAAVLVGAVLALARLPGGQVVPSPRAESTPAPLCAWAAIGAELPPRYHAAGVVDPVGRKLYYYGGIDIRGSASGAVDVVDLDVADLVSATVAVAAFDGQQPPKRWGHAGVYRPMDDAPGEIYWIAGQGDDHFEPSPTPSLALPPRPTRTPTPRPT